jgi:tetratricopeptide (TPR) repeat protein
VAAAKAEAKQSKPQPKSAKEAVEAGLNEFQQRRDYDEAVRLFKAALDLKPSSEEAAAALFNLGCAYAKQRKFKDAADAIGTAINEHNLKLGVALKVRTPGPGYSTSCTCSLAAGAAVTLHMACGHIKLLLLGKACLSSPALTCNSY